VCWEFLSDTLLPGFGPPLSILFPLLALRVKSDPCPGWVSE